MNKNGTHPPVVAPPLARPAVEFAERIGHNDPHDVHLAIEELYDVLIFPFIRDICDTAQDEVERLEKQLARFCSHSDYRYVYLEKIEQPLFHAIARYEVVAFLAGLNYTNAPDEALEAARILLPNLTLNHVVEDMANDFVTNHDIIEKAQVKQQFIKMEGKAHSVLMKIIDVAIRFAEERFKAVFELGFKVRESLLEAINV